MRSASETIENHLNSYNIERINTGKYPSLGFGSESNRVGTVKVQFEQALCMPFLAPIRDIVSLDRLKENLGHLRASLVVVIAHGSQEGLVEGRAHAGWDEVADAIDNLRPELVVMCTCYGSKISEFIQNSWGFEGQIDAISASLIVSGLLVGGLDGIGSTTA